MLKDIDRPEPLFELVIDGAREPMPAPAQAAVGAADPEAAEPADPDPAEPDARPSIRGDFARLARETIESRVLAQLEQSLGDGFPFGNPRRPPGPSRRTSKEIERLKELRDDGALTAEQYERAVDRLLEDGPAS
jgi:hypothetical protein